MMFVFYLLYQGINPVNHNRYGGKSTRKNKKNLIKIKSKKIKSKKISGGAFQPNDPLGNALGEILINCITFFFRRYFDFCGYLVSRTGAVDLAGAWGL